MIEILPIVEKNLTQKAKNNNRDYSYFHASEWDKCHRKIAYEYYESKGYITLDGSSIKVSPLKERVYDVGHSAHFRWKGYLEETGALMGKWECLNHIAHKNIPRIFGCEEKLGVLKPNSCSCGYTKFRYHELSFLDDETMWGGSVDAILDLSLLNTGIPLDERYLVVDFKTINPMQYKTLTQPMSEHDTQMQIYLYLTNLKYGKFIYEDKWTQGVKEFLVTRDEAKLSIKKDQAYRLKYLVTHTNNQGKRVLPERAYESRANSNCLQCKYRSNCWRV